MIDDHDQDVMLRCRRLGHEVTFSYCRRESCGQPCSLILDCWWERFDVRSFLEAHMSVDTIGRIENAAAGRSKSKLLTLLDLADQAKERVSSGPTPGGLASGSVKSEN